MKKKRIRTMYVNNPRRDGERERALTPQDCVWFSKNTKERRKSQGKSFSRFWLLYKNFQKKSNMIKTS